MVYKHQKQYYELLAALLTYSKHTKKASLDSRIERLRDVEQKFFAEIYPTLRYNKSITISKAAKITGKARHYLLKLVSLDVLETVGKNKDRRYVLKDAGEN